MTGSSEFVLRIDMASRPTASTRRPQLSLGRLLLGMLGLLAALVAPGVAAAQPATLSKELIARGKYVFGVAAGCGCHTEPKKVATELNAGGRKYDGPFGTVYATQYHAGSRDGNRQVDGRADHHGHSRRVAGPMASGSSPCTRIRPSTAWRRRICRAVVAYLRSVPPVRRANTPKKISVPMFESVFLPAWLAAFAPRETPPATAPTSGVAARRIPGARGRSLRRVPHAPRHDAGARQ